MSLPSAEQIQMEVSKERILPIQPWVAAQLSDVWQGIRKNIQQTIEKRGKSGPAQTSQAKPASSHNLT